MDLDRRRAHGRGHGSRDVPGPAPEAHRPCVRTGAGGGGAVTQRRSPLIAAAVGAVLVGLLAVLALADPGEGDTAESPLLGRPAPAVRSATLDGGRFDLSRRKGSWVVLNFFNSTCVPCRNEHPQLVAFAAAQQSADDPVELYTVVNDDSDEAVEAFFSANGGDRR
ncbi:MAG: TlpA family protein disulfide reductase [Actinobacteria bacterium]|nr:TlpA family protein disulfide reductase [Actinomycetota bacterium]